MDLKDGKGNILGVETVGVLSINQKTPKLMLVCVIVGRLTNNSLKPSCHLTPSLLLVKNKLLTRNYERLQF